MGFLPHIIASLSPLEHVLHGGPGLIFPCLLMAVAIVVAMISVFRCRTLGWRLLLACLPFLFAAVASHNDMTGGLSVLSGSGLSDPKQVVERFTFGLQIYQGGVLISFAFGVVALIQHFVSTSAKR